VAVVLDRAGVPAGGGSNELGSESKAHLISEVGETLFAHPVISVLGHVPTIDCILVVGG
jgi:hypothetical protein